jgi:hypothetical protein
MNINDIISLVEYEEEPNDEEKQNYTSAKLQRQKVFHKAESFLIDFIKHYSNNNFNFLLNHSSLELVRLQDNLYLSTIISRFLLYGLRFSFNEESLKDFSFCVSLESSCDTNSGIISYNLSKLYEKSRSESFKIIEDGFLNGCYLKCFNLLKLTEEEHASYMNKKSCYCRDDNIDKSIVQDCFGSNYYYNIFYLDANSFFIPPKSLFKKQNRAINLFYKNMLLFTKNTKFKENYNINI